MTVRKPVLRVWCLPVMPEDKLVQLHKDLVAAAVSIQGLNLKGEEDLITLFPADLMKHGLGSEIYVEYDHTEVYWKCHDKLPQLASKLGNVVKRHLPTAFVQCEACSEDGRFRAHWTCKQTTTREEVERVQAAARKLLPRFQQIAGNECYCAANNIDFKGPCHHHYTLAAYEYVVKEGARVLALVDPADFQAAADLYVERCREATYYDDLHKELGWTNRKLTSVA
jgi:hypothetical protein